MAELSVDTPRGACPHLPSPLLRHCDSRLKDMTNIAHTAVLFVLSDIIIIYVIHTLSYLV